AKLCEEVIAPLYHSGDEEGCLLVNGEVRTPKGYKEAYEAYVAGGWQGLSHPVVYGGQGLPIILRGLNQDMIGTANRPFYKY
ncbi:acyl-CoA dehydrogenase, partial [Pseudomonas aeruginosa]